MKLKWMLSLLAGLIVTVQGAQTQYVFLVTGDGIRHQEVFGGVDPALAMAETNKFSGIETVAAFRAKFWDADASKRRENVMPFTWGTIAKQGAIFGNRALGSKFKVSNPHHFSYPGYAEILNGQPLEAIKSNDAVWSPRETILEFLRRELNLPANKVAAFGSWSIFNWITMQKDGAIFCNAGYEAMPSSLLTDKMRLWDDLQFTTLSGWDTVRHDSVTFNLAMEYIRAQQPKFFYLALGETDDWAHDRRYDRTIETLQYFDRCLSELWTYLQSAAPYKGKSTLIITTDHGRGRTVEDWTSHNNKTPGADESWLAVLGPDTPALGEVKGGPEYSASNIAATIVEMYGLDLRQFNGAAAPAMKELIKPFAPRE